MNSVIHIIATNLHDSAWPGWSTLVRIINSDEIDQYTWELLVQGQFQVNPDDTEQIISFENLTITLVKAVDIKSYYIQFTKNYLQK
jgi:hypothetical protein